MRERRARPVIEHIWCGIALILPITVAALVYVNRFDLSRRPGRIAYVALYILVLVGVVPLLRSRDTPSPIAPATSTTSESFAATQSSR